MKGIALEEHYTTAALADSFRSVAIGFDKEAVARPVAGLPDFDSQRLETIDQASPAWESRASAAPQPQFRMPARPTTV